MKQIMQDISDLSDVNIEVMETDKDHIHMMICSEPKLSPLQIVISDLSDVNIEVMETDKDHIHMMICSEPKLSPLQIVRRLKQM